MLYTPWLLGLPICAIVLLAFLFFRNRRACKNLETLVKKRTNELALQTTMLKEMEAASQAASRSKSVFLANMSHEIRTPLNAILGITELLLQRASLPTETAEGLEKIYSSSELLLGVLNDILDFSKIAADKIDIMPGRYKVANMIGDTMRLNMMRINNKSVDFELHIDENIPANLVGDIFRIKQILNNLLSNAFKYTAAGKVTLSVTAEAIPGKEEVMLVFVVRDTGCGMTKTQLGNIYEEYARFNHGGNIAIEGTGLGLLITQSLVNRMNGEIHIESEPGGGSIFSIRLPQKTVDMEALGKATAAKLRNFRTNYQPIKKKRQLAREPMPYGSVLIVDDVEMNLYVAEGLMKPYKLQTDTAMSGWEAIEKIQSGKVYDIVFMDHMMPEMDGMETTKYLRDMGYNAPIVALTANAVTGQADVFLQNGFDDFIPKPIDIRQLNSVLNKLIRDKQSAGAI